MTFPAPRDNDQPHASCLVPRALLLARILPGRQITQPAERALFGVFRDVFFFLFIGTIRNRLPQATIQALELPRIDRQFVGLKVVVFADEIALVTLGVLGALAVSRFQWTHGGWLESNGIGFRLPKL